MIDATEFLTIMLNKVRKEFEEAKAKGDFKTARMKALECAKYCFEIAKKNYKEREYYFKLGEKWKRLAETLEEEQKPKKVVERTEGGYDFRNYIESLIAKSKVRWEDIGGLEEVKRLLMETVVIAGLQKPESIKPWKGILLFGPPGTGKTLLASACAGSLNATFFNVKADKVLSKYFGESSKLISALYQVAREKAPSIVFIDEFDALSLSRSGEISEASRRMLSTLLAELDGFQDKKSDLLVLTLAATNTPWDLDQAVLSRFPRRIYVPLPDKKACVEIIKIHTKGLDISRLDLKWIAEKCVEMLYSGRDIANLCQEAVWVMVRDVNPELYKLADLPFEELRKQQLNVRPLEMSDFEKAFKKVKSTLTRKDLERYVKWNEEFGG